MAGFQRNSNFSECIIPYMVDSYASSEERWMPHTGAMSKGPAMWNGQVDRTINGA